MGPDMRLLMASIVLFVACIGFGLPLAAQEATDSGAIVFPTPTPDQAPTAGIGGVAPTAPLQPTPQRVVRRIPVIAAEPVTRSSYYMPQPGESIDQIAALLGIDLEKLMAANGLRLFDTLVAGVPLRVPGPDGRLPPWSTATVAVDGALALVPRRVPTNASTPAARNAGQESP